MEAEAKLHNSDVTGDFLKGSNYEAISPIGVGSYGVVWAARHKRSQKKVAIKRIYNPYQNTQTAKYTFREIRIMRHFSHENIMGLIDVIELENIEGIIIVMELMDTDLARVINSKTKLTDAHYQLFTYQILRGLKYIHSANIIHRDLKPQNCLVNKNCDLKISDFGMGRECVDKLDKSNNGSLTTLWYRAPEQLMQTKHYSTSADIWSVGCILAEMIRGRPLLAGHDINEQLSLIFEILEPDSWQDIPSEWQKYNVANFPNRLRKTLSDLLPDASVLALDLLSKMLVFEPEHRVSCEEALRHPFFEDLHDSEDEPASEKQVSISPERTQNENSSCNSPSENYKAFLLEELQSFRGRS